jgi:HlyD family secretion protein
MDSVHNLSRQKTLIMIAHSLSTVRNCDTIFLVEKGRVTDAGPYEVLLASSEAFRRMAQVDDTAPPARAAKVSRMQPSGGA